MVRPSLAGLALALAISGWAHAQCTSVPYTFTSGETASASQVNANFACAALLGGANFTGNVGVNDSSPAALISLGGAITTIKLAVYNGGGSNVYGMGVNSGELTFGAAILPTGVPQMVLTDTGAVGIGTTDPTLGGALTSVFTAVGASTAIAAAYNTSIPSFAVNPLSTGGWDIYDHEGGAWHLDLQGLDGGVIVGFGGSPGPTFYVNGTAGGPDAWEVTSDARLKTKIEPITGALELIGQLQGVRYEWKSPDQREVGKTLTLPLNSPHVGFIAQDVAKVVPEAVAIPKPGSDEIYGLRADNLIPFLVEAIKAQQAEIKALQAEVATLKGVQ